MQMLAAAAVHRWLQSTASATAAPADGRARCMAGTIPPRSPAAARPAHASHSRSNRWDGTDHRGTGTSCRMRSSTSEVRTPSSSDSGRSRQAVLQDRRAATARMSSGLTKSRPDEGRPGARGAQQRLRGARSGAHQDRCRRCACGAPPARRTRRAASLTSDDARGPRAGWRGRSR